MAKAKLRSCLPPTSAGDGRAFDHDRDENRLRPCHGYSHSATPYLLSREFVGGLLRKPCRRSCSAVRSGFGGRRWHSSMTAWKRSCAWVDLNLAAQLDGCQSALSTHRQEA
jgi:hypothetical protein